MTARRMIFLMLALTALQGAVHGYSAAHPQDKLFSVADFTALAFLTVATYLWYFVDAREQKYRRTAPLGGAIIMFSLVAVPYYLYRSRPVGVRAGALFRYVVLLLLSVLIFFAFGISVLLATGSGRELSLGESGSSPTTASSQLAAETCFKNAPHVPQSFLRKLPHGTRTMTVRIEILPPGVIGEVVVLKSSGEPELDAAVVNAYKSVPCVTEKPVSERQLADQAVDLDL